MIQLNFTQEQITKEEELQRAVNQILVRKIMSNHAQEKLTKCFDYYNGKEPIVIDSEKEDYEPKVFNLAKPIVDTATKTFVGVLPDITTDVDKDKDKITKFNQKLYARSFGNHIYQCAKNSSICGTSFLALYNELGDTFPRFRELSPQYADVVYDCSLARKKLFAFNIIEDSTYEDNQIKTCYICYVYTKEKIYAYKTGYFVFTNISETQLTKDLKIAPHFAFSYTDKATNTYVETSSIYHGYKDIPIVELPNNNELKSDTECVFDLIKLYNELQNNRAMNVQDIVHYVLLIKNARFGNEEESSQAVDMLKKNRVLPLEGENVDARFLSNPLNQTEIETLAKSIKYNIDLISRVPDLSGVDFSQNASDPILKIKTKPLLDLCCEKELAFTEPYLAILDIILEWCKNNDKDYKNYYFNINEVALKYAHPLPSNDLDMATQIANLSNSGVLNPEVALQEMSWIPNVSQYIKGATKWNESVDKRKELIKNNNEQVANETNLERQNEKPITNDRLDNSRNGALGESNKISDNKV